MSDSDPVAAALAEVGAAFDALLGARAKGRALASMVAEQDARITALEQRHDRAISAVYTLLKGQVRP